MQELPETHQHGMVSIHNQELIDGVDLQSADFGLQIASDGRVWVCINGIAYIRFKPTVRQVNPIHESEREEHKSAVDSMTEMERAQFDNEMH